MVDHQIIFKTDTSIFYLYNNFKPLAYYQNKATIHEIKACIGQKKYHANKPKKKTNGKKSRFHFSCLLDRIWFWWLVFREMPYFLVFLLVFRFTAKHFKYRAYWQNVTLAMLLSSAYSIFFSYSLRLLFVKIYFFLSNYIYENLLLSRVLFFSCVCVFFHQFFLFAYMQFTTKCQHC